MDKFSQETLASIVTAYRTGTSIADIAADFNICAEDILLILFLNKVALSTADLYGLISLFRFCLLTNAEICKLLDVQSYVIDDALAAKSILIEPTHYHMFLMLFAYQHLSIKQLHERYFHKSTGWLLHDLHKYNILSDSEYANLKSGIFDGVRLTPSRAEPLIQKYKLPAAERKQLLSRYIVKSKSIKPKVTGNEDTEVIINGCVNTASDLAKDFITNDMKLYKSKLEAITNNTLKQTAIAIVLYTKGIPVSVISSLTGLTEHDILGNTKGIAIEESVDDAQRLNSLHAFIERTAPNK